MTFHMIKSLLIAVHAFVSRVSMSFSADEMLKKVNLATVVEGEPKALFSITTTPRCRGGCYTIPWIALLYPRYVPYDAEC